MSDMAAIAAAKAHQAIMDMAGAFREAERERIKVNIEKRIEELSSCNKDDDCAKIADYIESYLPEWVGND